MSVSRGLTHLFQFDVIKKSSETPIESPRAPSNRFSWAAYAPPTPPAAPEAKTVHGEYGHAAAIRALYQPSPRVTRNT